MQRVRDTNAKANTNAFSVRMAVVGVGGDLVQISRVRAAIARWGVARFARRIFTGDELAQLAARPPHSVAAHIAGR